MCVLDAHLEKSILADLTDKCVGRKMLGMPVPQDTLTGGSNRGFGVTCPWETKWPDVSSHPSSLEQLFKVQKSNWYDMDMTYSVGWLEVNVFSCGGRKQSRQAGFGLWWAWHSRRRYVWRSQDTWDISEIRLKNSYYTKSRNPKVQQDVSQALRW